MIREWLLKPPQVYSENEIEYNKNYKECDHFLDLKITEFEKRKLTLYVYSKKLNRNIVICSNDNIAGIEGESNKDTAIYTTSELRRLLKLQPNKKMLNQINTIKEVFNNSELIKVKFK